MHDESPSNSSDTNNPRNNPRQHKRPTRRHAGAVPGMTGAVAPVDASGASSYHGGNRGSGGHGNGHGHEGISPEAAARAAYEEYAAATERPHPASTAGAHHGSRKRGGYGGYAETVAAANPRVNPAQKVGGQAAAYADMDRYIKRPPKKRRGLVGLLVVLVLLGALGAGAWYFTNPPTFNTTVNGMTCTVQNGTTLAQLVDEGVVTPKPGNLVAVDGEVLEEGGGTPFTATIDGREVTDPNTIIKKGESIQVNAGTDVMEEYDAETVTKKPKTVELGQGAIHAVIVGETGEVEKRTGKTSGKTVKETVKPVVNNTYFKYNANTGGDKVIALTFDDGPWDTTHELLDVLKEYKVKATFFTIGNQIENYTDTVKRAKKEGHQISTHTWDHAYGSGHGVDLTLMTPEEQIEEVTKGQDAVVKAIGGDAPKAIRAPGGNFHDDVIWNVQPYVDYEIGWNIDTEDWRRPGVNTIADSILQAQPGDIVLMHDGGGDRSQTIEALKIALPKLVERGYSFVTIDELLAYDDAKALAAAAQEAADAEAAAAKQASADEGAGDGAE